ncbi:hypothetical protein LOTGIDRAFT_232605 [Lottia gigantea]|uniref:Conserved oligomeric Golgi complex subunit 2 n=1 Tax=Lottia gigantea TaxID=225164 RepID=V4AEG4_LOTGI|nr:hypothetical protein LOTGIDRAFT_232605 [Lottia gigantea]ESO93530.1 hypothetical protein LOTGIDRAFT_232605 [Lottia gigantea]
MTVDAGKGFSLPSGPASLCFDKEEFMKPGFDVDQFVLECRRRVQLETLRDDLNIYLKILKSAMIELINKDYADFVNLSTNLVGMDKAIGHLTVPLGQLKEEVMSVRSAMDEAIEIVEQKLKQQKDIQHKKACLQRLMNITESVEKIEKLLGIHSGLSDHSEGGVTPTTGQLSGQLIERVATEFNKLQFYVTKSRGLPLVEKIKPRIANITTTLQFSLEGGFLDGLATNNVEILRQCLRTYALIDKTRDAENLFRQHIVKPYMEEVVTEDYIKVNGLEGMIKKILEFIPKHCKILKDVTSGVSGTGEIVRGYDFLVNSVWPEIVGNLEARTPTIFAPGNPDTFHEKYLLCMEFLCKFEKLCGNQGSIKHLREHSSYHTFLTKWSLPVYFQIRFQDIAGSFETALVTGFNNSQESTFQLMSTSVLWQCLHKCWKKEIYLPALSHRFWKLTIQLLSRYTAWLDEVYEEENNRRSELDKPMKTSQSASSLDRMSITPDTSRSASPSPQDAMTSSMTSSVNPPITVGQIVCLISDSVLLVQMVEEFFDTEIAPLLEKESVGNISVLKDCIKECIVNIEERQPKFQLFITSDIIKQCSVYLKQVSDIPRLYRKTNREVPSKPSNYIISLEKPLKNFLEEHQLESKQKADFLTQVFSSLTEQYITVTSDVLTSVKKMEESLKRLKKARGTDKSSDSNSHGMSDDDKVRQQIILDIDCYGNQISGHGIDKSAVNGFDKLLELAQDAKSAMTS